MSIFQRITRYGNASLDACPLLECNRRYVSSISNVEVTIDRDLNTLHHSSYTCLLTAGSHRDIGTASHPMCLCRCLVPSSFFPTFSPLLSSTAQTQNRELLYPPLCSRLHFLVPISTRLALFFPTCSLLEYLPRNLLVPVLFCSYDDDCADALLLCDNVIPVIRSELRAGECEIWMDSIHCWMQGKMMW